MACINRTTNKLNEGMYHIYSQLSPVNYKKDDGDYEPIDLTFEDATSTIGDISLNRKNVFSTGIRKDKNPNKFVGIRPDNCQDGSKQIEFSINNVKVNGVDNYDIDDFEVKLTDSSFLKLYKNNGFKDFEIEFKIDLKGVSIGNDKYTEATKIRNSLKTEFINLGQDTGANILNRYANDPPITESDSYLRIYNGQITDDFFARFGYSSADEFGDADLSNYSFYDMSGEGSSIYLKDNLVFYAVGKDIDGFVDSVLLNLCNKYNLSLEGSLEDTGKYFFKDGKKIGGYAWVDENKVLAYFNTKEIPADIKLLYLNKDFNETSFINLSQSQFNIDIETQFNYDVRSIEVDSDFYSGDIFGIKISKNSYWIMPPIIMDENYNTISNLGETAHTLKDNGDGTYTYTKYLSIKGILRNLGNSLNFIDVNINSTASNHIMYHVISASGTGNNHTSANLTIMRNLTAANTAQLPTIFIKAYCNTEISQTAGSLATNHAYRCRMSNLKFDTSAISTATDVTFKHYSQYDKEETGLGASVGTEDYFSYILLKSTKAEDAVGTGGLDVTYSKNSWNDMVGHTSGWDSSDVTEYSLEQSISDDTAFAWTSDDLNATAVSDANSLDDFCFIIVEHKEYYSDSLDNTLTHGGSTGTRKVRKGLNITTESPNNFYIEVTVPTATATDNATFFGANF